jgi:hypothetical protein
MQNKKKIRVYGSFTKSPINVLVVTLSGGVDTKDKAEHKGFSEC